MHDKALRLDLIDQLDFKPRVDAVEIGVSVEDDVVTLTGHAPTCSDKATAPKIVQSVSLGTHER